MKQLLGRSAAVGAIGTLCVVVGGVGIAAASNGGSLILGHSNTATNTTTVKDSKGTPLALVGKASKPPLKVNSSKQVAHLNASMVGGKTASQLSGGSAVATAPVVGSAISADEGNPTLVLKTATLKPGTYFVNASEVLEAETTSGAFCYVARSSAPSKPLMFGGNYVEGLETGTETLPVKLSSPIAIGVFCYDNDDATDSLLFSAGMTATRVSSNSPGAIPAAERAHGSMRNATRAHGS